MKNITILSDEFSYINNKNFVKDAHKFTSCEREVGRDEVWIGNTSGNIQWEAGVDIPKKYAHLKTIRLGEQAYDIEGNPISRDYCRPLIVHKSEEKEVYKILQLKIY